MTAPDGEPARPYAVLVVHPYEPAVLVDPDSGRPPVVALRGREICFAPVRVTDTVRDALGIATALLRAVPTAAEPTVVVVPHPPGDAAPSGLAWSGGPTGDPPADGVLAELRGAPVDPRRPVWYGRGYPADIEAWAAGRLDAAGTPLTGPLEQLRSWEISGIWRARTTEGLRYVKATAPSPLFVDEGAVTATLAALFPGRVAEPVAVDSAGRRMIMIDFGAALGWSAPLEDAVDVVRDFARLQIDSIEHVDALSRAGLIDRRLAHLAATVPGWVAATDLRAWFTPAEVPRVRALAAELPVLAGRLAAYGLPDTLLHGDMHTGNVARRPGGFVYFDWTDASIGHPFLDMITIRRATDPERREALRDAYLSEWSAFGDPVELLAAWDAAGVCTAFHHALSYASIVSALEPPVDPDFTDDMGAWLRQALDAGPAIDAAAVARTGPAPATVP